MPRSEAIVRSPAAAIETTTPVRPATGPGGSTPRSRQRARDELAGGVVADAADEASPRRRAPRPTRRRSPPGRRGRCSCRAGWSSPGTSGRVEAHDDVEQEVAEGTMRTALSRSSHGRRQSRARGCARSQSAGSSAPPACWRPLAARRCAVAPAGRRARRPGGVRGRAVLPRARRRGGAALPRGRRDRRPARRTRRSGRS